MHMVLRLSTRACARGATCCLLSSFASFALLLAVPASRHGLTYYRDWLGHTVSGVRFHLDRDVGSTGIAWHADKTVLLTYAGVVERLKAMPAELEAQAGVTHLPALAENDFNPAGYAGVSGWSQVALGAAPHAHKVMREFINSRVSAKAPSSLWNVRLLRQSAAAFLAGHDRLASAEHAVVAREVR